MAQIVYKDIKRKHSYKVRQSTPLYTDGLGQTNEVGELQNATEMVGGGTFLNDDGDTFITPVELLECVKLEVIGVAPQASLVAEEATLSLLDGDFFILNQDQNITQTDINGTLAGKEHAFVQWIQHDATGTVYTYDWSSVFVDSVAANLRWAEGIEPALTQEVDAVDIVFFLIKGGINLTGSYLLDVGEDPAVRKGRRLRKQRSLEHLPIHTVPANEDSGAEQIIETSSLERVAQVPIRIEGDAVVGALQRFGSTPEVMSATAININGVTVSACKMDTMIDTASIETNTSELIVANVLEIDMSLGRMVDFVHDDDVEIHLINVPEFADGEQPYIQLSLMAFRDASVTDRNILWDALTVNGILVPVLWEGKLQQTLGQNPDEISSIVMFVFDGFVVPRIVKNIGAPLPLTRRSRERRVAND